VQATTTTKTEDKKMKITKIRDTEIKIENYSWGTLRVISVGSKFSIVIHPEDAARIAELEPTQSITFKEETGSPVIVTRGDEWEASMNLNSRSDTLNFWKGHNNVAIKISRLELN
jgi:hypothetical protein